MPVVLDFHGSGSAPEQELAISGRAPGGCAQPVPVIAFHGTRDPINPYSGGGPDYWRYGIDEAYETWVTQNRCPAQPDSDWLEPDVEKRVAAECAHGSAVTLYRIEGAGHVWPGSAYALPSERFGVASGTIDATGLMLDFFWQFRRDGS